jgi:predicted nucleic acid-binding protein
MNRDERPVKADAGPLVLDACTVINLAACEGWKAILSAVGFHGVLAPAVAEEAISVADPDPEAPPDRIDLRRLAEAGVLRVELLDEHETATWVALAGQLGDGEAASLALAEHRGWPLATDDRKARAMHARRKLPARLWSTSELLRAWAERSGCSPQRVAQTITRIERFGCFVPGSLDPEIEWWEAMREGRDAA